MIRIGLALVLAIFSLPVSGAQYAVVDSSSAVVNIVEWDGASPYAPGTGLTLRLATTGDLASWNSKIIPAPPIISSVAFWARFTASEQTAIATAAQNNASINVWLITALTYSSIDLTNQTTKAGLDALVAAGLLTSARETAILTP